MFYVNLLMINCCCYNLEFKQKYNYNQAATDSDKAIKTTYYYPYRNRRIN